MSHCVGTAAPSTSSMVKAAALAAQQAAAAAAAAAAAGDTLLHLDGRMQLASYPPWACARAVALAPRQCLLGKCTDLLF